MASPCLCKPPMASEPASRVKPVIKQTFGKASPGAAHEAAGEALPNGAVEYAVDGSHACQLPSKRKREQDSKNEGEPRAPRGVHDAPVAQCRGCSVATVAATCACAYACWAHAFAGRHTKLCACDR